MGKVTSAVAASRMIRKGYNSRPIRFIYLDPQKVNRILDTQKVNHIPRRPERRPENGSNIH
jgi:hypothetical protein